MCKKFVSRENLNHFTPAKYFAFGWTHTEAQARALFSLLQPSPSPAGSLSGVYLGGRYLMQPATSLLMDLMDS